MVVEAAATMVVMVAVAVTADVGWRKVRRRNGTPLQGKKMLMAAMMVVGGSTFIFHKGNSGSGYHLVVLLMMGDGDGSRCPEQLRTGTVVGVARS